MKALVLALLAACISGCAGTIHNASTTATEAAVDTLDSKKYKGELDDMAAEAAGAARDKALDADTTAKLVAIRDAMLDEKLRVEIAGLREEILGARTRELSLQLVDGSLTNVDGAIAQWRETAFGKPLRDDLDALAGEAAAKAPAIAQAGLAGATVTVNAEASKAEHVAIWIGVGLALLLVLAIALQTLTHRKLVAAMAAGRTP